MPFQGFPGVPGLPCFPNLFQAFQAFFLAFSKHFLRPFLTFPSLPGFPGLFEVSLLFPSLFQALQAFQALHDQGTPKPPRAHPRHTQGTSKAPRAHLRHPGHTGSCMSTAKFSQNVITSTSLSPICHRRKCKTMQLSYYRPSDDPSFLLDPNLSD